MVWDLHVTELEIEAKEWEFVKYSEPEIIDTLITGTHVELLTYAKEFLEKSIEHI